MLGLHASYEEEDTCMRHMRRRMHVESSLLSCDRMLGLHVMLESTFLKFNYTSILFVIQLYFNQHVPLKDSRMLHMT